MEENVQQREELFWKEHGKEEERKQHHVRKCTTRMKRNMIYKGNRFNACMKKKKRRHGVYGKKRL